MSVPSLEAQESQTSSRSITLIDTTNQIKPNTIEQIANEKSKFKRKDRIPSNDMYDPDGRSYRCFWIEDSITIHSDGNVSCGLDDPHAQRSFGNVGTDTIEHIFSNAEFELLQSKLKSGYRCKGCSLYVENDPQSDLPKERKKLPSTIIVETTVRCNLRCPNEACIPNNDPNISTRDGDDLELEHFKSVIMQLQNVLQKVYFFNYGDPFLNKNAEEMLLFLHDHVPSAEVATSTNAIPLAKPLRSEKIIAANITYIVVTLSGIDQESYGQYHKNGRVELALRGLRNLCEAKKLNTQSNTKIIWRYLLFRWNDSDEEITRAVALSKELGVDQFSLYLTHFPIGSASFRFAPGTPSFNKFYEYIDLTHGYNSEAPQQDGFYRLEHIDGEGEVRWTSSNCQIDVKNSSPYVKINLATVRMDIPDEGIKIVVDTPWLSSTKYIKKGGFNNIAIRPPLYYRLNSYIINIEIVDYWFPAEKSNSADLRCLGVLYREENIFYSDLWHQLKWIAGIPKAFFDKFGTTKSKNMRIYKKIKSYVGGGRLEAFDNH